MKSLLLILSACLLFSAQKNPDTRSDREKQGLKGPVKTVREERAEATLRDGGWVEGARRLQNVVTYDKDGRKVGESRYGRDGSPASSIKVVSDAEGNTVYEEYKPDGTLMHKTTYKNEYDAEGRPSRTRIERTDGLYYDGITTYNSQGKPLERRVFERDGSLKGRSTFVYDDGGTLVEFMSYDAAGVLTYHQKFSSTEQEITTYLPDGTLRDTRRYKKSAPSSFDAQGNWTKEIRARTVIKDGSRSEEADIIYRTFTYH